MRSKVLPIVAVAVVMLAGGAWAWQLSSGTPDVATPTVTAPAGTPTGTSSAPTSAATGGSTSVPTDPPSGATSSSVTFRWQPLWPFGSLAAATAWQGQSATGSRPWNLDPAQTAIRFCATYLGFSEVDRALSTKVTGEEAWVGVAGPVPEGTPRALAVLHLARFGAGPVESRPWEVVGSEDTRLTLTQPGYGASIGHSVTVGGRITGVDESLRITVRSLDRGVLGSVQGLPAGGTDTPWSATLTVDNTSATQATIVVSTGGHLTDVEGFAITGVVVRPAADPGTTYATPEAAIAPLVMNGVYVGDCDHPTSSPGPNQAVCSALKGTQGSHRLYFVGYSASDVGYFVVLASQAGRWVVIDDYSATPPASY